MRLFISYARVDKPLCKQIVAELDEVHEVWYDKRLFAGQDWWGEIQRQLHWCEGFVYLLSPESVASEYCQQEFGIADSLGKYIFPVLIQARTDIPKSLQHIHYADLSDGMENLKVLLNAITVAERIKQAAPTTPTVSNVAQQPPAAPDATTLLTEATQAMDANDYDRALFLLKQIQANGLTTKYTLQVVTAMLADAEKELERQAYLREAEREYAPLISLVKGQRTRAGGCAALQAFHRDFPDYDPENLATICAQIAAPPPTVIQTPPQPKIIQVTDILPVPFEWCSIPKGFVTLEDARKQNPPGTKGGKFEVAAFQMAKYPITNAQYHVFVDASDGYANSQWWDYSSDAQTWRTSHPTPEETAFAGNDLPRTNVCWYEAVAFCRWLNACIHGGGVGTRYTSSVQITLPTEQQWQRAAQGDDNREYPWGNDFDSRRCNTAESGLKATTPVTRYDNGASPYSVYDMAGNVWEWCLTEWGTDNSTVITGDSKRLLRGGTWRNNLDLARIAYRFKYDPNRQGNNIGFRLALSY